jgi:hypothetical protein
MRRTSCSAKGAALDCRRTLAVGGNLLAVEQRRDDRVRRTSCSAKAAVRGDSGRRCERPRRGAASVRAGPAPVRRAADRAMENTLIRAMENTLIKRLAQHAGNPWREILPHTMKFSDSDTALTARGARSPTPSAGTARRPRARSAGGQEYGRPRCAGKSAASAQKRGTRGACGSSKCTQGTRVGCPAPSPLLPGRGAVQDGVRPPHALGSSPMILGETGGREDWLMHTRSDAHDASAPRSRAARPAAAARSPRSPLTAPRSHPALPPRAPRPPPISAALPSRTQPRPAPSLAARPAPLAGPA